MKKTIILIAILGTFLIVGVAQAQYWAMWKQMGNTIYTAIANLNVDLGSGDLTTTGTGTLGSLVVDSPTLVVNASGYADRVGIGTASPEHLLDVGGMEGTGAPGNLGIKSDSGAWAIRIEENSGVEGWHIGVDVDGDLNFDDSNTGIRLTFQDETGNVGIGTTSPGQELEIYSSNPALRLRDSGVTATATTAFVEFGGTDATAWNRTGFVGDAASGNADIYLQAEDTDLHLGDSSGATVLNLQGGNVGIGTATPSSTVHVIGDLDADGLIIGTTSGGTVTDIKDEDDMASDSQISLATQQSIKAYVDTGDTAIYAQLSDSTDQTFAEIDTAYSITFNTNDEMSGITHSTSTNPEDITIVTSGVYSVIAQPQVATGAGGAGYFHMWLQKNTGGGFVDVANSNIELTLASQEENVIPLIIVIDLTAEDIVRLRASVGDTAIKLDAQTPASEPAIPSIIFSMYCVGR